jgi:hypothetical protein
MIGWIKGNAFRFIIASQSEIVDGIKLEKQGNQL